MEKMERKIQEVAFDVEIQYCNPDEWKNVRTVM